MIDTGVEFWPTYHAGDLGLPVGSSHYGAIHSFRDLDLILSKVEIAPAKPKTKYIDIPGGDGSVDLTEANGEVKFYDRDCKFTFSMNPATDLSESEWEEKKSEASKHLNGLVCRITLDKDPEWYYLGRCTVENYLSNKRHRQIVVTAKVNPYKLKHEFTRATFEIVDGACTDSIELSSRKTVCPNITCTNDGVQIHLGRINETFALKVGTYKYPEITFVTGESMNTFTLFGEGRVTFKFREGEL